MSYKIYSCFPRFLLLLPYDIYPKRAQIKMNTSFDKVYFGACLAFEQCVNSRF